MAAEFKIDFVPVRILPQPLVEVSALVRTLKLDFASKSLVQFLEGLLHGAVGAFVPPLVVVECRKEHEPALILLPLMEGRIARGTGKKCNHAMNDLAQWTVIGLTGVFGADVTKNVEEEGRADHEPAPILRRPTVERSALEPVQKLDHVTTFLVQVMVHGLHGNRGEHVHCLVQEVLSAGFEHAQTRLRLSVESIAREMTKRHSLVIPFPAQWMETGPNGDLGADVQ